MRRLLPIVALLGCTELPVETDLREHDPVLPPDTDLPIDTDEGEDGRCAPPLTLTAPTDATIPLGIVDLEAAGGTGAYRFTLVAPERGIGFVESRLGRLLVGDTPGVPHVVEVTDDFCEGSAEITIDVVPNLSVSPDRATVLPGVSFRLETSGGLGEPTCTLLDSLSGAAVEDCVYTAGEDDGLDRIEVVDEASGDRVVVRITVESDSPFGVAEEGWWIPVEGWHTVRPTSGSGTFSITLLEGEGIVSIEGDTVVGLRPGTARLRLRDRYSGHAADVSVQVVAPLQPPLEPTARGRSGRVVGGHDLDGDGYDDIVLAMPEFDRGGRNAGYVAVYRGGPDGAGPDPALELGPSLPADSFLGEGLDIGDWNGDGKPDLAVGAWQLDAGLVDSGGVYLIPSFLEADPTTALAEPTLRGEGGNDYFGTGVALCDFDGDGLEDLAVGAYRAEDGRLANTGAIYVYRGDGSGFSEEPSTIRWGERPTGDGGWEPATLYLGRGLLAEDVDADGACDLISSTWFANLDGRGQDGVVTLYRGVRDGDLLEAHPSRVLTYDGSYTLARMGWQVDVGDFDGDGFGDLVLGTYTPEGSRGQVHVLPGSDWLADGPVVQSTETSRLYLQGEQSGDQLGQQASFADVDGDGVDDLLFTGIQDESSIVNTNAGQTWWVDSETLRRVRGRGPHDTDSLRARPLNVAQLGSFTGIVAGLAGDTDGDGVNEVLVHTLLDASSAIAGYPELVPVDGSEGWDLTLEHSLDQPGTGTSMALADATGDGRLDAIVGSWVAPDRLHGQDAGSVWSFAGTARGFSPWARQLRVDYPNRFAGERFGRAMTADVDIDGDGWNDLVIASERSWRQPTLPESYTPRTCGPQRRQAGAVQVFRGGLRGFATTPSLTVYGVEAGRWITSVGPAGDFDGDGFDDVMVGSSRWGSGGGVWLLRGRPLPEAGAGTTHVCMEADERWLATESGALLGEAIAPLGDIDGDGCADVAVGARGEDRGRGNQGVVRVLWGGGPGCNTRPAVSQLVSGAFNGFAGERLAGGVDLSGDGVNDLLIGAPRYGNGGSGGLVWAVSGVSLRRLDRTPIAGSLPDGAELPAPRLDSLADVLVLREPTARARFGDGLVALPDPEGGPGLAFIGRSALETGGGLLYRLHGDRDTVWAEDPVPVRVLAGEPTPGGLGSHATCDVDGRAILVGAPSSGDNAGAVYALPVDLE